MYFVTLYVLFTLFRSKGNSQPYLLWIIGTYEERERRNLNETVRLSIILEVGKQNTLGKDVSWSQSLGASFTASPPRKRSIFSPPRPVTKKELPFSADNTFSHTFFRNFKVQPTWETAYVTLPFCVRLYRKHKLVSYYRGFNINSMTPFLTSSCAKSIRGSGNLNVQIGHYRPRFSGILRPLTLRNYAISILPYYWNKQASGDKSKINQYFLHNWWLI